MIEGIPRKGRESPATPPGGGGGIDGRHPRKEGKDDGGEGEGGWSRRRWRWWGGAASFLEFRVVFDGLPNPISPSRTPKCTLFSLEVQSI